MSTRIDQQHVVEELVNTVRAEGVDLLDPGGLLADPTKAGLTEIGVAQVEVRRLQENHGTTIDRRSHVLPAATTPDCLCIAWSESAVNAKSQTRHLT